MTDRLKSMVVGAALLSLPLFTEMAANDASRTPKLKALVLMAGLCGGYYIARHMRLSLGIAVGGLSVASVLHGMGGFHVFDLVFVVAATIMAYQCVNLSERGMNMVLDCIAFSGVLCAAYGYLQMTGDDPAFFSYAWAPSDKPVAFLGQHTIFGSLVAVTTTAALFRKRFIMALFQSPTVFATESSFAVFSLAIGVLAWILYSQGWRIAAVVTAVLASALLFLYVGLNKRHYFDSTGRFAIWQVALNEAQAKPLTGWGPGMFKAYFPSKQPVEHRKMHGRYEQAHNDYLQAFYEYGIWGILCAILLVGDLLRETWRKRNITSVVALSSLTLVFLVNAIGSFPFHLLPHALIALCAWTAVTTHKARPLEGI